MIIGQLTRALKSRLNAGKIGICVAGNETDYTILIDEQLFLYWLSELEVVSVNEG